MSTWWRWQRRYHSRVDRRGADECWPWTGKLTDHGYSEMKVLGQRTRAHRIAYFLAHGPIQYDLVVRHTCDNPPCCNPAHLLVGTQGDNMQDKTVRGRAGRAVGVRNVNARLDPEKVRAIRAEYVAGGVSLVRLGAKYGVDGNTIHAVVTRRTWKEVA